MSGPPPARAPVRVLVVDDDADVRRALKEVIGTDPALRVVAEAGDGRAALVAAGRNRVDVVLLDLRMPGLDGLGALDRLKQEHPEVRVVVLTTFGEGEYVRRAVASGADGFLLKSGDPRALLAAVHGAAHGEAWLSPAVARFVTDELRRTVRDRRDAEVALRLLEALTARERDVVRALAHGSSNAEIAAALFLSESTVKAYLGSAMARTGTRNRVELAALVWRAQGAP